MVNNMESNEEEIDLSDYTDADDETDLEIWVKNVREIFESIDEGELGIDLTKKITMKLISEKFNKVNEKFDELLDINAALVVQIRMIKEGVKILDTRIQALDQYKDLNDKATKILNGEEKKITALSTSLGMFM